MILFLPFPLLSHYTRCFSLARKINAHKIIFAAHPGWERLIGDHGFDHITCSNFDPETVMRHTEKFNFAWLKAAGEILNNQLELIRNIKPDLVISDATVTAAMACSVTGTPHISIMNAYLSPYYSIQKSVPGSFFLKKLVPHTILERNMKTGEKVAQRFAHKPLRRLRSKYKLEKRNSVTEEFLGDHTLFADLPELYPQENLPENISFTGPLYHDRLVNEGEIKMLFDPLKKKIIVTMGSTGKPGCADFLKEKDFDEYQLIIAGKNILKDPPPGSIVRDFIFLPEILPYADLVICHGGNGTVYQALEAAKPVLAIPAHFEQEWNVQPLVEKGLVKVAGDSWNTQDYRNAVACLIDSSGKNEDRVELSNSIKNWRSGQPELINTLVNKMLS